MSTANLAAALAKVQAGLPELERDRTVEVTQKNGQTYSYSYVTLANLNRAVLPLLAKHGLVFVTMPGVGTDGKMVVHYRLMHDSGEELVGEFPISAEGGIQMIGGRITYIRRYCLAAIVGVAADEDDDSRLSEDGAPRTAQRVPVRAPKQPPAAQDKTAVAQRSPQQPHAARPPLPGETQGRPEMLTAPQRAKLLAIFGKIGISDRDERLQLCSQIVNRRLSTANDLTKAEAMTLIDTLEDAAQRPDPRAWLTETVADLPIDEALPDGAT